MTPEMITAIGALVAAAGGILSAILLHSKTTALLEQRLKQVEGKLDDHNGYAKMFAETTTKIAQIEKDVAVIKTALEYIQKEVDEK